MRLPLIAMFLAACGGTQPTSDAASDAADETATEVETVAETEADSEPDTAAGDAALDGAPDTDEEPDGWDRAPSWLAVVTTGWADGTPRTVVGGALWAAPEPESYALVAEAGSCRLSLGENYFCDPPCEAGLCTAPGPDYQCTPFPAMLSAGALVVSGGGEEVSLRPSLDGYASESEGALWPAGTELTFTAAGGEVPGFTTTLRMVEPIAGQHLAGLDLKQPLVIQWAPPTSSGAATRVNIKLQADRGQHGRAYSAVLECDVPDTGRFEIPAALQARYVADDLWGCGKCPASTLTRYVRTRVTSGGHVIDISASTQELFLLTPWTTPAP